MKYSFLKNWSHRYNHVIRYTQFTDSMDMGLSRLRELVVDREDWRAEIHGVAKSWTGLSDWTDWTEQFLYNHLKNQNQGNFFNRSSGDFTELPKPLWSFMYAFSCVLCVQPCVFNSLAPTKKTCDCYHSILVSLSSKQSYSCGLNHI